MQNLKIELGASRHFIGTLIFLHLGAIICCLPLSFGWLIKLVVILLCLGNMVLLLRKHTLQSNSDIIVKCHNQYGKDWLLESGKGEVFQARLFPACFQSKFLIVLNFKVLEKRKLKPVIIFSDSVSKDVFRQLRVYLQVNRTHIISA